MKNLISRPTSGDFYYYKPKQKIDHGTKLFRGFQSSSVPRVEITGPVEPLRIGVSLLSSSETGLKAAEKLMFPEVSVEAATSVLKTDQPLWRWFAAAGLIFLLLEWWYFQKRPSGVPG